MKTLVKIFNKKGQRVITGCLDVSGTLWVNRADLPAGIYNSEDPQKIEKKFQGAGSKI